MRISTLITKTFYLLLVGLVINLTACGGGGGYSPLIASTGITTSDFSGQIFITKGDATTNPSSTEFLSNNTGNRFLEVNNQGTKSPFTWSITNGKLDLGFQNNESFNFSLINISDNKYKYTQTDNNGGTSEVTSYRAKPITLAELNTKILAFDTSNCSCTAQTVKITGTSVVIKSAYPQILGGNISEMRTISEVAEIENMLKMTWTNQGDQNEIKLVLIEGDIAQTPSIAFIETHNDTFRDITINVLTATTNEAF